jgi:hypothetical protein
MCTFIVIFKFKYFLKNITYLLMASTDKFPYGRHPLANPKGGIILNDEGGVVP